MVTNQGLKNINIYDIFANIVPGITFLLGLGILINTSELITALFGQNTKFSLRITVLLLFAAVAFVVGQLLQAIAGRFDGDHGFPDLLDSIRNEDDDDIPFEISEFEGVFWTLCREYFVLTNEFQSPDRLFKAVLAFLEERGRSRALRMQALYLFGRGMFFTSAFLTFLYSVGAVSIHFNLLSENIILYLRSVEILTTFSAIGSIITYVFYKEREEFELDWIKYVMIEFYLEAISIEEY